MSAWDWCGIGIVARRGLCGGGGGIAGIPSASASRRESGAAIASSTSTRSTSPVTARIRPSGPTRDSWKSTRSRLRMRRTRSAPPFGSRPYGWSFGNTNRASSRAALDAQVVQQFDPHALDLPRGKGRMGDAFGEDPDRFLQGIARAPTVEAEELLAVVELEGRPDPFESVREFRGSETSVAAEEEPRGELGDPVRIPLRRHAGRDAPPECDEWVRREGAGDQDGPVAEDGAVGEVQPVPSWTWKRTTDRCSSTRYVRATSRMRSARTLSTFARSLSPNSQDDRPSPALRSIPWNVTPSCSYRAHERTCCFARSTSVRFGGARRSLSTSRSITCSTRSRGTPFANVADTMSRDGSSFISCLTPTSVASLDSTRARYRRFDRGRQSPDAKEIRPRQPPRTVESRINAGVSSWAAAGMCHPIDSRSAGPGRTRSLRRSPRCSGSESRKASGAGSGFRGEKASRTRCIATAGSKPPTRRRVALFGA